MIVFFIYTCSTFCILYMQVYNLCIKWYLRIQSASKIKCLSLYQFCLQYSIYLGKCNIILNSMSLGLCVLYASTWIHLKRTCYKASASCSVLVIDVQVYFVLPYSGAHKAVLVWAINVASAMLCDRKDIVWT